MLADNRFVMDTVHGRVQNHLITEIGVSGRFFVVPSIVTHDDNFNVQYAISGEAIPILAHASATTLRGRRVRTLLQDGWALPEARHT